MTMVLGVLRMIKSEGTWGGGSTELWVNNARGRW